MLNIQMCLYPGYSAWCHCQMRIKLPCHYVINYTKAKRNNNNIPHRKTAHNFIKHSLNHKIYRDVPDLARNCIFVR